MLLIVESLKLNVIYYLTIEGSRCTIATLNRQYLTVNSAILIEKVRTSYIKFSKVII